MKILKICSTKLVQTQIKMIGGGCVFKNSSQSQASSWTSMFNGEVKMFDCWCPRICVIRKTNTSKNQKVFLHMPFIKGL